jgi:hypothetical protein
MPDSLPLVRKPSTGKCGLIARDIGQISAEKRVSTNTDVVGARHLDVPPRDVGRLLERHGASLPLYLDAQRWRDIAGSRQRWPRLWSRDPKMPGDTQ